MMAIVRRMTAACILAAVAVGCRPRVSGEAPTAPPDDPAGGGVLPSASAAPMEPRQEQQKNIEPEKQQSAPPVAAASHIPAAVGERAGKTSTEPAGRNGQVSRPRLAVSRLGKRDLRFDDLEFDIERDGHFDRSMLPDAVKQLDGRTIVIRGFMLASSVLQQTGIEQFVLVRDNQQCCFGPGAYVYHNMRVQMQKGESTSFQVRPVTVEGKLSIDPWIGPDGKCYSVYHLTASSVR